MHVAQQENAYAHEFYRRRDPCASPLWKLMDGHLAEFERAYPQRYEQKYGFWRPVITLAAERFLKCGDLREGFARVHCDGCGHDLFVSFSCKTRCLCPSCHQKRILELSMHVREDVFAHVPHRQFVFTIPKRLRIYFRFNRSLLGRLPRIAYGLVRDIYQAALGLDDVVPGPASGDLRAGVSRNFQVFDPLDFLAEITQHVPNTGEHTIRYYGWYSNKSRGIRAKLAGMGEAASEKNISSNMAGRFCGTVVCGRRRRGGRLRSSRWRRMAKLSTSPLILGSGGYGDPTADQH